MSTATTGGRDVPSGLGWWAAAALSAVVMAAAVQVSVQLGLTLAVCVMVAGIHHRSSSAGLVALWTVWLLAPAVRRVVELSEGYANADPLSVAPFAVTGAVLLVDLARVRPSRRLLQIGALAAGGYLIGVPAGLVAGPVPMAFNLFAYGIALGGLVLGYQEASSGRGLWRSLELLVPVLAAYGLLQYVLPLLPWDDAWLKSVDFTSVRSPGASDEIRLFSTLNSPNTFAAVLCIAILGCLAASRLTAARGLTLALAAPALALTFVRSAWVALVVGLVALAVLGGGLIRRRVIATIIILLVAAPLAAAATGTAGALGARLSSLSSLSSDVSARERLATPARLLPEALASPFGHGLGQAGEATRLGGQQTLRAPDNAYLSLIYQVGPVGALLVLAAIGTVVAAAVREVRRGGRDCGSLVAATVVFLLTMMFAQDLLYGVTGVVFWYLAGAVVASREQTGNPA